jgi:hypothetical protein
MRKTHSRKSQPKPKTKPTRKIGFFVALPGTNPLDDGDFQVEVLGTEKAAIDDAMDQLDDMDEVYTIYELVPRVRVELPEEPEAVVTRL